MNKPIRFALVVLILFFILICYTSITNAGFLTSNLPTRTSSKPDYFPARIEAVAYRFEIKNSKYLNITIDSSEEIQAVIESVPHMVLMRFEAASESKLTNITINNLQPLTKYYKYEDNHHNLAVFVSDEKGSYSYFQDLTKPHLVFIKPEPSTKYIKDNLTGGDCILIGEWNNNSKTCTLVQDIFETVQIDSDNITLDGAGHSINNLEDQTGFGVFVESKNNITIKDLRISNFTYGIYFYSSSLSNIVSNILQDNYAGISLNRSNNNILKINTASNNIDAVSLVRSSYNLLEKNNLDLNESSGIFIENSSGDTLKGNNLSNSYYGVFISSFISTSANQIYNNNFIDNFSQVGFQGSYSTNNIFDQPLPVGGNYWNDNDVCVDSNGDSICDSPYIIYQSGSTLVYDRFPWQIRDGWFTAGPNILTIDQYKLNSTSSIFESATISQATFSIRAVLSDPQTDQVKLEVELKPFGEGFDTQNTNLSAFVDSRGEVSINIRDIPDGDYHWRARIMDSNGDTSPWEEFGVAGNIDIRVQLKTPVILIPGILGSWWKEILPNLNQADFVMDPLFKTYEPLIKAFQENGYPENDVLFPLPYDWRLDNRLTAVKLKDRIAEIKYWCSCNKVDIVAHSMGGLVARYYIENDLYQSDIDNLILLGVPNNGSPKAYLTWEAGELTPYNFVLDRLIEVLLSPLAHLEGFDTSFNYVHNKPIISIEQLLPTYDYLRDSTTGNLLVYPNGYPQNPFLSNLDSLAGLNSPSGLAKLENSGVKITNIVSDQPNGTIKGIRIVKPSPNPPLWVDGYPEGYDSLSGDHGLELGNGDGTVPTESAASLNTSNTNQIILDASHGDLPTAAWPDIFEILTGTRPNPLRPAPLINRYLITSVYSPVDFQIVDPSGRRLGRDFENGINLNEIPDAYYTGNKNNHMEFVIIPDPLDGGYRVITNGTDSGNYKIEVNYISDEASANSSFTANTNIDVNQSLLFNLNNSSPQGLEIIPEDQIDPTTLITISGDQTNGWYTRNVLIALNAVDNSEGVGIYKTEYSLDNGSTWQAYTSPFIPPDGESVTIQYRSEDYMGNSEQIKSITINIDQTPPEAIIFFDPITRYLKIEGLDNLSIYSVNHSGSVYTVTDHVGHTLKININSAYLAPYVTIFNVLTLGATSLDSLITSLQYDSNQPISTYANLHYEWTNNSIPNHSLKTLAQSIVLPGQIILSSTYDSLTNKTTATKQEGAVLINWWTNSMDIFKLNTNQGKFRVEY